MTILKTHAPVAAIGVTLALFVQWKYESDLATAQSNYLLDSHRNTVTVALIIERTLNKTYAGLRTIGRLPAIRDFDRADAARLDDDSMLTVQEIFNDLAIAVPISEVFIVPSDFDPDRVDPATRALEAPFAVFDAVVVDDGSAPTPDPASSESTIYEHRRVREQLEWMAKNVSHAGPDWRDVPVLGGTEVVTGDTRRVDPEDPDDQNRLGLVFSVPFYGRDGVLRGCVSGVILTQALRDLIPAGHYMLLNRQHGYLVEPLMPGQWALSRNYATRGVPDPTQLYSETIPLGLHDATGDWILWASQPDDLYWVRPDVQAAQFAASVGAGSSCAMTIGLWTIAALVRRNRRTLESEKTLLEARVENRTSDLNRARLAAETAAAARRASEERARRIVDSSLDAIVETNHRGEVTTWNPRAQAIFGWSRQEAVGRELATLIVPPEQRAQHRRAIARHDEPDDGSIVNQRIRLNARHRNGHTLPIEMVIVPIRAGDEGVFGVFMVDLTDRVDAERERAALHRQLIDTSRAAGKAEVASSILHNVGNVLTSVNTSAHEIARQAGSLRVAELMQVAKLVEEHAGDMSAFMEDERGRHLPRFLTQYSAHLAGEQQAIVDEIADLTARVDHIKQIVRLQQSAARTTIYTENITPETLVCEAIDLNSDSLDRHGIVVERDFAEVPEIRTDRHQVLQVLVNLLGNAKNALAARPVNDRLLVVRIRRHETAIAIKVIDNGVGISAENLRKLFRHGFTTRKEGHGFGLHSAALAARQLGGTLTANSDGPGCGATFVLELPLVAPAELTSL